MRKLIANLKYFGPILSRSSGTKGNLSSKISAVTAKNPRRDPSKITYDVGNPKYFITDTANCSTRAMSSGIMQNISGPLHHLKGIRHEEMSLLLTSTISS